MRRLGIAVLAASLAVLAAPKAHSVTLETGDLVLSDSGGDVGPGAIFHVDPVTGVKTVISSGPPLASPFGLAIDAEGNLLVADADANAIFRIDPETGEVETVSSDGDLLAPSGVAIGLGGEIYVADVVAGEIFEVDAGIPDDGLGGNQTARFSGGSLIAPFGIAFEPVGDFLLVTDRGTRTVVRLNPKNPPDPADLMGGNQEGVSAGGWLESPFGIALDANGDLLVADRVNGIVRVDPVTGDQDLVSFDGGLEDPSGIAIDANGDFLIADFLAGAVFRIDRVTGLKTTLASGFVGPSAILVVPPLPAPVPRLGSGNLAAKTVVKFKRCAAKFKNTFDFPLVLNDDGTWAAGLDAEATPGSGGMSLSGTYEAVNQKGRTLRARFDDASRARLLAEVERLGAGSCGSGYAVRGSEVRGFKIKLNGSRTKAKFMLRLRFETAGGLDRNQVFRSDTGNGFYKLKGRGSFSAAP